MRSSARGNSDTRSWQSFRMGGAGTGGTMAGSSCEGSGGRNGASGVQPDYDHALASQLRRLFFQRVDIFAPVEANRESILFGIIKIGLKVTAPRRFCIAYTYLARNTSGLIKEIVGKSISANYMRG